MHPNSLANLKPNRKGSKPKYETAKVRRSLTITEVGWKGFKDLADRLEMSASELVEQLGRGNINLSN